MQHNGLMDAFYGFQPIIIMDLLTKVSDALQMYPLWKEKEQRKQRMKRLRISQKILARNVFKIQASCVTAF